MRRVLALLLIWFALPAAAAEEDGLATLVADRVEMQGNDTLTASGAVEVYYQGSRLTATRIVYDQQTDRVQITGPITLTDGTGTVLLADQADLSADLTEGVLTSARMVLDQQMQIAAAEAARIGGRYTRMSNIVASSCTVCPSDPTPLWEIRARRVIHDQEQHQLYFDGAQFRVGGVPILYMPTIRIPDSTLKRATGFLMPNFRTTTSLGPGLKLPYFIVMGDSRDLTLTPYFSTGYTQTLEFRYREALRNGSYQIDGAFTHDSLIPGDSRGYVFASGEFDVPRGYTLGLKLETVSDDAYLLDYDKTDRDRLESGATLTRTKRNEQIDISLLRYWSLRDGDDNRVLPSLVGDISVTRRFTPDYLGGEGQFTFSLHGQRRSSTLDYDANGDGTVDGRDSARASFVFDWSRSTILDNGMVLTGGAEVAADFYHIWQDASYASGVSRFTPQAALELRWPWVRSADAGGASHVIEPVAQLIVSPNSSDRVPNEDSFGASFDEGNLFAFSRFPGEDRRELGTRLNLGLGWTRYDPAGWTIGVTAGRVFRASDRGQFSEPSGLSGASSDWLLATQFETADGLLLINRAVFTSSFDMRKEELRIAYDNDDFDLSAGYLWLVEDPSEGLNEANSELAFDGGWRINDKWRGSFAGRYDFEASRAVRASVGLSYTTECAVVDLSLSRRFTSSTSVSADTDINLSVILSGFGNGPDGRAYRRSCSG